jgi:hypothetical protein
VRFGSGRVGSANGRLSDALEDATGGGDNPGDKLVGVCDQRQDQFSNFPSKNGAENHKNGAVFDQFGAVESENGAV